MFLYYYRETVLYLKARGENHFKLEKEVLSGTEPDHTGIKSGAGLYEVKWQVGLVHVHVLKPIQCQI